MKTIICTIIIIWLLLITSSILYEKINELTLDIAELKEIVSEQPEIDIFELGRTDQTGIMIIE